MSMSMIVASLLALAVLLACTRLLLGHRRDPRRPKAWRLALLLLLQPLMAGALYLMLFPPERTQAAGVLTVLTEGANSADWTGAIEGGRLLALPEAPKAIGIDRVPDLGTALRRYPGTREVRVLGAGLVARDRDAAAGVKLSFEPVALPRGLVRIDEPRDVALGATFVVSGRIEAVADGRIELQDPAGRRIDSAQVGEDGGFALDAVAFAAGPAAFRLRLLDADGKVVEEASVPVWVREATPPRVLLLAGAPNAETRALRRWLEDAGASVSARIALGGGVQLGDAATSEQALAQADLAIIDARSWSGLGEGGRSRMLEAVRGGLGLLLQLDTALPGATLRGVRSPGFAIEGGGATQPWTVAAPALADEAALRARFGAGTADAPFDAAQLEEGVPALTRRNWRVAGADAVAFATDGDAPVGWWRGEGRGRIGVWTLLDSYQWPLHGRTDLHGALWSDAVATLGRARNLAQPAFDGEARVGGRMSLCGVPEAAVVEAPAGHATALVVDPATGTRRCAAFWPQVAGWHSLRIGEARHPFHVAAADAQPGLRLTEMREATALLAAGASRPSTDAGIGGKLPGPSWPWFLAWLLLAGLAWWLERSRAGLAAVAVQQDRS